MKKHSADKAEQAIRKRLKEGADREKPKFPPNVDETPKRRRLWPFGRKNKAFETKERK